MSSPAKPIKVVAFNGSHLPDGSTGQMINILFEALRKNGIECEMVMVGNAPFVSGCIDCGACKTAGKCVRAKSGDPINEWYAKMMEADGIVLATPTHYAGVSTAMKSLIDRCGQISLYQGGTLKNKIGTAVVSAASSGAIDAFNQINHFFTYLQVHVVSGDSWNDGIGLTPSEVASSPRTKKNMESLAANMAFLLKKLHPERAASTEVA
ncbi:putative NADPH-dependent FMN reductase [Monocercomonoides exilis]|uniref:putative NADPH-dependent FMN reductase n=1 Tax=Monocercomonoides exilis TaxID=2049356 RepID=UPI00355A46F2|nr:putative NADPH-dependent FMN reductase [Monocercomonoides exilis]|eukprot:MONOS_7207.1-p1 / transcript=MONOS_7207.1 / gene=MONOS_7207 / organism=Monocercomonoides_exilis_PA203 / gene_product=NADPH-dependent FMN reductase / transcript_product=NADPH-dependent FMN reductase / location=Mono_scaffold00241:15900-16998(-) / protein_length=208 / sequence_SO=supercontig / SO=protein_coding / is_pseudo=false